jgi:hypothetical protein
MIVPRLDVPPTERSDVAPPPGRGFSARPGGPAPVTALPDPSELAPRDARALVARIRREGRPALLGELQRLYGASDATAIGKAQIVAAEIQLQKLDQYLLSLLPVVRREDEALGWEHLSPRLRAVRRPGPSVVQADVDLPFTPENHECVHGPCTLVPVSALARRLLAPGEHVAEVARVSWAEPMRHRARLTMWDAATAGAAGPGVFSGRLLTSAGRALEFAAAPLVDRPISAQMDYNDLSRGLVRGGRFERGADPAALSLALNEDGLRAARRALRSRPALGASLVLDLVPMAILNWKRGRPMMACGYSEVPLPRSPGAAFAPGTRLEIRYRAERSHASRRSGLWIGHYEFRYRPRQEAWSTMVMAEADELATLLRKLHS